MNRSRGGGWASAQTITSCSALATTTRSTGSVSSGERRSAELRGRTRTMRASVPSSPEVSPASITRSPTTTLRWPSSRAFIAVTGWPSIRVPYRPRSVLITNPSGASAWAGRRRVRGRVPRPGRTRTSSSSRSRRLRVPAPARACRIAYRERNGWTAARSWPEAAQAGGPARPGWPAGAGTAASPYGNRAFGGRSVPRNRFVVWDEPRTVMKALIPHLGELAIMDWDMRHVRPVRFRAGAPGAD